jgi:DNA-binding NarL/FixJ family response regulator
MYTEGQITNHTVTTGLVLIVDDDSLVRASIKKIVQSYIRRKKLNYEILEGTDGSDLVNYVMDDTKHDIKLIITDENMTHVEGSAALLTIKDIKLTNDIKVISITSMDDLAMHNYIKKCGADEVYMKPSSKHLLEEICRIYLK